MQTKQLVVKLLSNKVKTIDAIFESEDTFNIIIEFARDAAKEFFATQVNKQFLPNRVDDVAYIVDQNMQKNKAKMHKKLCKKFTTSDVESTIAWLIDRWINTFVNLTTNCNYRDYFDISSIVQFDDNLMFVEHEDNEFFLDDIKKFDRNEIKKALKVVWQDSILDSNFDLYDFKELCQKYNFSTFDILSYHLEDKIKMVVEINENQHQQMMFDF